MLGRLVTAVAALLMAASSAQAQTPYYQGKTLRIVVGFTPGGGNDLFARIFTERLGKHIDGNPNVVVENMPGAGGVLALNWFAKAAPRDGTVTQVASGNLVVRMVLGTQGTTAKLTDMVPMISGPLGRVHYAHKTSNIKTPKDVQGLKQPLFLGVTDPLATVGSVIGFTMLKIPFKAVAGYPGKNDALLAFERGEVTIGDMVSPVYVESVLPMVQSGVAIPLYAQGFLEGDNLVRDPVAPELPTFAEFYRAVYGSDPSGSAWEALKAIIRANGNAGKILFLHSQAPVEARDALRKGLAGLVKDEIFIKNSKAALEGYDVKFGPDLDATMEAIKAMPNEAKTYMRELFAKDYDIKFD